MSSSEDAERKEKYDILLGVGKVSDVCRPEYCRSSDMDRHGIKECKDGHPTGKLQCCPWHSDEKYKCKT